LWIAIDDVHDILSEYGYVDLNDRLLGKTLEDYRNFLPGLKTGKISFQEFLAIENSISNYYANRNDNNGDAFNISSPSGSPTRIGGTEAFSGNSPLSSPQKSLRFNDNMKSTSTGPSTAVLQEEFKRLDLLGEGKLTFLSIKSALELRGEVISDENIRAWMQKTDIGGKGHIDEGDFIQAVGMRSMDYSYSTNTIGEVSQDRYKALRSIFSRYDIDGDGYISVNDIIESFKNQGRTCTEAEALAWVRKRDSIGSGGVMFEDFMKHYQG
jgi:calcium-binding protein CML